MCIRDRGRREYIDSSGIGKDRGNRVICRLVCDLMPGHTDIVIFLYMCKGIRSEIAFSCLFFDGGKHTFLHVSNNTVVCHYFVPVVALFEMCIRDRTTARQTSSGSGMTVVLTQPYPQEDRRKERFILKSRKTPNILNWNTILTIGRITKLYLLENKRR